MFSPATRLYGVIGNPVKHSASPRLFNNLFHAHGYNAVYLGFENSSVEKLVESMRALSIAGYSVTIPFKEEVIDYLDKVDETASRLGCVNTIWNDHGCLIGYNFDGKGALFGLETLEDSKSFIIPQPEGNWWNSHFIFLGNGGAARGILLTLITTPNFRGKITVVARNPTKTEKLFKDAHSLNPGYSKFVSYPWEKLNTLSDEETDKAVVINATSLGMFPYDKVSPVPKKFWSPGMIAYDIVYNPLHTCFLRDAEEAGAQTITGLNMFLGQARLQLLTWTGIKMSMEEMHRYFNKENDFT